MDQLRSGSKRPKEFWKTFLLDRACTLEECYENMDFGGAETVKRAVAAYKQKYHYSRPDMMRLSLVKQINGAKL